ncbi:MAG: hypothetical protein OCD00_19550 [Colwellia sp.]
MTTIDEILILANQLANEGKKPTVALLKTRLTKPVPLPTIINTLKGWQHDPDFIVLNNSKQCIGKGSTLTNELEINQLTKQSIQQAIKETLTVELSEELAEMKKEIKELKQQIIQLNLIIKQSVNNN